MTNTITIAETLTIQNIKEIKEEFVPIFENYDKDTSNTNEIEISLQNLKKFDGSGFQFLIALMKDSRIKLTNIPESINKKFAFYGF